MTGGHRRAAVLGHPIAHSLSPVLHRAAYRALGLDWRYDAVDVTPDRLADFLAGLGQEWVGLSLTMPLKEAVLPLLTTVSPEADRLASVNTVLLGEAGERHGANTDVPGLVAVLAAAGAEPEQEATVLGGGATARSTLAALAGHGASRVTAVVRRPAVGEQLTRLGAGLGIEVVSIGFDQADRALRAPLVVSTVPPRGADPLAGAVPDSPGLLVDVVYDPWPTALAAAWRGAGGVAVGGLELLVHQAVEQVRLMTGQEVPASVLRAAGEQAAGTRAEGRRP